MINVCFFHACRFRDLHVPNMKYDIEFKLSRRTMRVQHRALELALQNNVLHVLFPTQPQQQNGVASPNR